MTQHMNREKIKKEYIFLNENNIDTAIGLHGY